MAVWQVGRTDVVPIFGARMPARKVWDLGERSWDFAAASGSQRRRQGCCVAAGPLERWAWPWAYSSDTVWCHAQRFDFRVDLAVAYLACDLTGRT